MPRHTQLDKRSLALGRKIADKVRADPGLVDRAKETLARWAATADESVRPAFQEWHEILHSPVERVLETLEGTDEQSVRLRQSNPFCGILTQGERTRIILDHVRGGL